MRLCGGWSCGGKSIGFEVEKSLDKRKGCKYKQIFLKFNTICVKVKKEHMFIWIMVNSLQLKMG